MCKYNRTNQPIIRSNRHIILMGHIILLSALIFGCVSASGIHTNHHTDTLVGNQLCENQHLAGEIFVKTELFFGLSKPDGSMVTDEEFERFLEHEVTPRFPDGLTLLVGTGQFKNSKGEIIREKSRLLILFYPFGENRSNDRIEQIRNVYKGIFGQESVIRADSLSCVSF